VRGGFAFYIDVNAARDYKERTNQYYKTDVFMADMKDALISLEAEEIVGKGESAK